MSALEMNVFIGTEKFCQRYCCNNKNIPHDFKQLWMICYDLFLKITESHLIGYKNTVKTSEKGILKNDFGIVETRNDINREIYIPKGLNRRLLDFLYLKIMYEGY